METVIATDASVDMSRKVAAWGWCSNTGNHHVESNPLTSASAEKAELQAILLAVKAHPEGDLSIYCDNTSAVEKLLRRLNSQKPIRPGDNSALAELTTLLRHRTVSLHWVRAHTTAQNEPSVLNRRVDKLVRKAMRSLRSEIV